MRPAWFCRLVGSATVVGFLLVAFTPLPNLLGSWLSAVPCEGPAGAIVVVGGSESEHRVIQGILLYRRGLAPLVVFSGDPVEVRTREALARDLGVPREALLTENTVRTTRDEAVKIAALLHPRGIRRILLVTDALGMRRAQGAFERAGFEVLPALSDTAAVSLGAPLEQLETAVSIAEEAVARLYYRMMGYL